MKNMNNNKEKNSAIFNYFNRYPLNKGIKKDVHKEISFVKNKSNKIFDIKNINTENSNSNNLICNVSRTENNKTNSSSKPRARNHSINQKSSNQKLNLNLNLNLNISNTQEKKLEDFINNDDASKLCNTKFNDIVSTGAASINKSPIFRRVEKSFFATKLNKGKMNLSCIDNNLQSKFSTPGTATGTFFNTTGINCNLNENPSKRFSFCESKPPLIEKNNLRHKILKNLVNKKSADKIRKYSTEANFITDTSRDKLNNLIKLLDDLHKKNNSVVHKEVKKVMSPYFFRNSYKDRKESISSKEENSIKSLKEKRRILSRPKSSYDKSTSLIFENKNILDKLENLDRKFNLIIKENKEIKDLIKDKAIHISKINNKLLTFKKEISDFKEISVKFLKFNKEHPLNTEALVKVNPNFKERAFTPEKYKLKSRNFSKSPNSKDFFTNPIVRMQTEDSMLGIYYHLFEDTIDLLARTCSIDAKNVIYLPKKVDMRSDSNERKTYKFKIPKLDINTAMDKLEKNYQNENDDKNPSNTDVIEDSKNFNTFEPPFQTSHSSKTLIKENIEKEQLDRAFISEHDSLKNENSQAVISFNNENSIIKN